MLGTPCQLPLVMTSLQRQRQLAISNVCTRYVQVCEMGLKYCDCVDMVVCSICFLEFPAKPRMCVCVCGRQYVSAFAWVHVCVNVWTCTFSPYVRNAMLGSIARPHAFKYDRWCSQWHAGHSLIALYVPRQNLGSSARPMHSDVRNEMLGTPVRGEMLGNIARPMHSDVPSEMLGTWSIRIALISDDVGRVI